VALRALEAGHEVVISEVAEHLAGRAAGSLGGIVLSGVVDRLPLHALVPLLAQCRRTLALGAPLVLVAEAPRRGSSRPAPAGDVVDGSALHADTWELLLVRAGFTEVGTLAAGDDARIALTAAQPA
jgi:S-adenosylmethionine:diacylglycerol 3-amino-3-carboxypropyl transferase